MGIKAQIRSRLNEATKPTTTYAEMHAEAEYEFLSAVAAMLNAKLRSRMSFSAEKSRNSVWLVGTGQDKSDLDVSVVVTLHTKSWSDIRVSISTKHAMLPGGPARDIDVKTGELTPASLVASILAEVE